MLRFWLLIIAVSWLPDWNTLSRSGEIRQFKQRASEAFQKGDYEGAQVFYRYLYENLNTGEEEVLVNLAHCYFAGKRNKQAKALYQIACRSQNPAVKTLAWQQLGVMAFGEKRYEWASVCFKNALKSEAANEDARYNYELTRKIVSLNRRKPNAPPPPKDSFPSPQAPPPSPDDWTDSTRNASAGPLEEDPYSEMGLTRQQAEIMLEAMKSAEKQYIQQQKKSGKKPKDASKPDW